MIFGSPPACHCSPPERTHAPPTPDVGSRHVGAPRIPRPRASPLRVSVAPVARRLWNDCPLVSQVGSIGARPCCRTGTSESPTFRSHRIRSVQGRHPHLHTP